MLKLWKKFKAIQEDRAKARLDSIWARNEQAKKLYDQLKQEQNAKRWNSIRHSPGSHDV